MSAVTVELPESTRHDAQGCVFTSAVCEVEGHRGERLVGVLLASMGFDSSLYLDADEARSLAAALLAAADASEVQG